MNYNLHWSLNVCKGKEICIIRIYKICSFTIKMLFKLTEKLSASADTNNASESAQHHLKLKAYSLNYDVMTGRYKP